MLVNQAKIYRRCGKPVDAHVGIKSKVSAGGVFTIQCFDKDGVLKMGSDQGIIWLSTSD